jgi:hypothetical protein
LPMRRDRKEASFDDQNPSVGADQDDAEQ